jgi:hypothetical protein
LLLRVALPVALVLQAQAAPAQTVGKVQGTVTDRDTGQPLGGVQVRIAGTRLGHLTDLNGFYFVNNVPVGAQGVTAELLGYQGETHEHLILAGQTTTVDFALTTEVIVADSAIVTVTELSPLVPRDNTVSKTRFMEQKIQELPLRSAEDLITLAAGATESQRGISLRGARPDDMTVYVDGLDATDFAAVNEPGGAQLSVGQKSPLELGQFAVEQVDVVTGGADASFGDLQSGVVNVVTSRGGRSLSGNLRFTTDALEIERTDDFYQLEGNVGGPVLPDGKASFFVSGTLTGSRVTSDRFAFDPRFEDVVAVGRRLGLDISRDRFCEGSTCIPVRGGPLLPDLEPLPLLSIETFVETYLRSSCDGTTCQQDFFEENAFFYNDGDTDILPGSFGDRYSFTGKLVYTPTANTDVQLSYSRSRDQGQSVPEFEPGRLSPPFNPFSTSLSKETVDFAVASWRQVLYQRPEKSLALEARVGYFHDLYKQGPLFDPTDLAGAFPLLRGNRSADDLFNFRFSDYEVFFEDSIEMLLQEYEERFDNSNAWADIHEGLRQPSDLAVVIPDGPAFQGGGADIFGVGAGGLIGFPLPTVGFTRGSGVFGNFTDRVNNREQRWNLRAQLDAQLSRSDRLLGGMDLKFFDVHRFDSGFAYFVEPRLFSFYVSNRLDLGDFVLDLGGRFDRFDHHTSLPEVPGLARTDLEAETCSDPTPGSAACTLREYDVKTAFGPRLGVAHPVTENTQVRFSYGVFNQLPGLDEFYASVTRDVTAVEGVFVVGNPELEFQRTSSFEVGITHLLEDDVVLDVVGYYREISKGTAARFVFLPQGTRLQQLFSTNQGGATGFDLTLSKRFSGYWSADLTYSFADSKMTDSDLTQFITNRGFNSTAERQIPPPTLPQPATFDMRHKLAGTLSLRLPADFAPGTVWGDVLQNVGAFATWRFNSGLPYTRQAIGTLAFLEAPNQSRRSSTFESDLRVTKYFELAGALELGGIIEVFNVFNNDNPTEQQFGPFSNAGKGNGVYNTTGSRLIDGTEIKRAEDASIAEPIVLADIPNQDTPGGRLTREFREFTDIDGDGILTHDEQRIMSILAFGAASELAAQPKRHYRLGVELRF